ncbi:terpene synthase family protein [Saccharopolyspora sp. MS10]|uniref:terpene synthase family protein n=1 Tax=Saccharopolyspora sp. MS10 TaxID=3385973 RepID=UPI0039A1DEB2
MPASELALITCFQTWVEAARRHVGRLGSAEGEKYLADLRAELARPLGGREPRAPEDPVRCGLHDLRTRVAPVWRRRLDTALMDRLRSRSGPAVPRVPNPIDHLATGRDTGPGPWAAELVAFGLRVGLSAEVAESPGFRALRNAFCDVVLLLGREEARPELPDDVVVLQRHSGHSREGARSALDELLARRAHRFAELTGPELPAVLAECRDPAQRDQLLRYSHGLQDWVAGLLAVRPEAAVVPATSPGPGRTAKRVRLPELFMPFDTRRHPRLETARSRVRSWAREQGLLGSRSGHSFEAADFPLLAALTGPEVDEDELALTAEWQAWLWRADDDLVAAVARRREPGLPRALHGLLRAEPASAGTSGERALADLWRRSTAELTARQQRELRVRLAELVERRVAELRGSPPHDPLELLASRRRSCGAEFTAARLRHRHAGGLPAELFRTAPLRALAETFAEISALHHDLFRFRAGEAVPEVVSAVADFLGCDPQQAVSLTADLCTARLRRFESLARPGAAADFGLGPGDRACLERYVRALQEWAAGELRWLATTGRYAAAEDRPRRIRRSLGRSHERSLRRAPS